MCGFAGHIHGTENLDFQAEMEKMLATIIHRGPDSGGIYNDENVTLGFRRLSIIDRSTAANQPLHSEDGNLVLVFNGEIYNYLSIKQDLIEKGYTFRTNSDSEVLLYSYDAYGDDFVKQLRGMFAICIVDKKRNRIFMARDIFGVKPFYYTQHTSDHSILFGSEIKSFLAHSSFQKELNREALRPYLTFQYSALNETFFKGVFKLPPAHYMIYENGQLRLHKYFDIAFQAQEGSLEQYIDETRAVIQDSVKVHQMSEVEVGSFLSGGVDSSYIASLLRPEKTFSVGFKEYESLFDETNLAVELSQQLGIQNVRSYLSPDDVFDSFSDIQWHMDEPHADPSIVPLYHLAKLASEHVTVVLSGEGADELFGGYLWYRHSKKMKTYEVLPLFLRRAIRKMAEKMPKNKLSNFLIKGGQTIEERFIGHAFIWGEQEALQVLKEPYRQGPSVSDITKPIYDEVQGADDLTKMQYLDLHLWMPGLILLKADKMSMAHSIEVRVPFLDKEVLQLASKIPSQYKIHEQDTKYVLRRAADQSLPQAWANRTKVGFPVPIRHWLRDEKYYLRMKQLFQSEIAAEFFHTEILVKYLDEHFRSEANHGRYIWTVFSFLVWYQRFFVDTDPTTSHKHSIKQAVETTQ